jgi:hypothetical protein
MVHLFIRRISVRRWLTIAVAALVGLCLLFAAAPTGSAAQPGPYSPSLSGHAVKFALSGFEPDFDPIYNIVISAKLHDAGAAVPDTMLVLSMYLEVFKPDTTPVLPDLLHPNQDATNLAGFMQGRAVLVNAAGHIAYKGTVLAEIFFDNSVHALLNLHTDSAQIVSSLLRLNGVFTLYKGGTQTGSLHTDGPMDAAARDALIVPRGPAMTWQQALNGVSVAFPKMMGTMGSSGQGGQAGPQAQARARNQARAQASAVSSALLAATPVPRTVAAGQSNGNGLSAAVALGTGLVLIVVGVLLWRASRSRRPTPAPGAGGK